MPPSPRYTVRLPHALDALVQARVATGTPFAVRIREALSAYFADSMPTPPDTQPTPADTPRGTYDPQAAVARMQALRTQGYSFARIAAQLTAEGIPTRY